MRFAFGFYDLSVCIDGLTLDEVENICQTLLNLGYGAVAFNQILEESSLEQKKKKKKGESKDIPDIVPAPVNVGHIIQKFKGKLKVYRRLTYSFSDNLQAHKISKSENIKKYDILAVLPKTDSALQLACNTLDIDIISFNPEDKISLKINRKLYNLANERGIYFELMYSPAIRDRTCRKNTIHTSHLYHAYGKSKKIIISSAASNSFHIRGPYDIINLGLILGLSEEQSKEAISNNCRNLLIHAEGRKYGKTAVTVHVNPEFEISNRHNKQEEICDIEMDVDSEPALKKLRKQD